MPEIANFAEELLTALDAAGAISRDHTKWTTMYGPHGDFARFSFRQARDSAPITLDLTPGLESGFGKAVEMLHSSGWKSIFGPELIGREQAIDAEKSIVPEIISPHLALGGYLNAAFTNKDLQALFRKEPQRRFQYALYKGMELSAGAGGLFMYGPVHSEIARADFTQRVRVGWEGTGGSEEVYQSVQKSALHFAQTDPTAPLAQMLGYGLYKDDSGGQRRQSYRPYSLGVEAQAGGSYAFDAMGISREGQTAVQSAREMVKRFPIAWGFSGVREQGFPLVPSGEHTMERLEPEFISKSPESAGYKWLNAILPGETERRAAYVRPNFAFTSASPVSGQAILYGGAGLPPGQVAYGKHDDVRLPDLPMQNLLNMDISLGIMRQTDLKSEAGDPIYQRVRPFEGATIPPKSQAIIGVVNYDLEGERRSEPITMHTGPTSRTLESADLIFPRQFDIASGEGLRHLETPGTPGVASGEVLAMQMQEKTGIPTWATAQGGDPLLQVGYAQGAWPTIKAFGSKQVMSELETPFGMQSLGPEIGGRRASGVTGEMKETLSGFVGHTAALTPQQQISMLGEFANVPDAGPEYGEMATEMQEYARNLHADFLSGAVKNEEPLDWNVISEIYGRHTGVGSSKATSALMYSELRSGALSDEKRSLDEYGYGKFGPEWWRWSMMSKETYGEVMRNVVQGADKWLRDLPPEALPAEHRTLTTPEGREYFKGEFPGETVSDSLQQFTRFTPMDVIDTPFGQKGPMGYAEFKGGGIMQTLVGGFTPEYSSQMPRFGQLERASIAMRFPKLAKLAGFDLRSGTSTAAEKGTALFPEHAKGWEELGDVIRRSKKGELRTTPEDVFDITPVYAEQMGLAVSEMAGSDTDYGVLQDLHEKLSDGHQGLLRHPDTGALFPRPIAQQRIEASEYPESSPFYSPISTLSHFYPEAFGEFLSGEGTMEEADPETRSLRRYYAEGMDIFEQGKGVDKMLKSVMTAGAVGGRYGGRFTAGMGHSIIQAQSLNNMLSGIAEASDMPTRDKNRFMAGARETVKAMQRVPGFLQRDPSLTTEGAVQPTWILPVDVLRDMGINIPRGTEFRGGKVNAGSMWESNLPFSSGYDLLAMTGDWDADQGQLAMIARVNPKLALDIVSAPEIAESLGYTQRHLVTLQEELMERQFGKEGIVPGGAMNIFADAWSSIIGGVEGGPKEPVVGKIPATTLHEQAWGTVKAGGGMGVAYNVRRLLGASSASLMGSPEGASGTHTSGALFYQEYLDKMASQVLERGGLRRTETMLNTATWGADFGTDELTLIARTSAQAEKFSSLWDEGGGTAKLTQHMVNALERDIGELTQPIGMEYPARLLAMREQHVPELQGMMEDKGITAGMSAYKAYLKDEGERLGVGPIDYDPTRSILGNAMVMSATFRAKGALGKQPRMVPTVTGSATLSMNLIGDKIVTYQSEDIRLRSLAYDARMLVGETAYSFETHQGIITPRMIHATAGIVSEMEDRGMPVPYVLQGVMGVFGGEKVAAEYARAAEKMGYTDQDRAYAGAIQVAGQMIKGGYVDPRSGRGEIRGSSLNYIGQTFTDSGAAEAGTAAHRYMEEYLKSPRAAREVPGLESVEEYQEARHGIAGTPDVIREMPRGTPFSGKRVGLDLKTGKSASEFYAGQMASYTFTSQLDAMGILRVPREKVEEIRKDVLTTAREERLAVGVGDTVSRAPLSVYREEIGARIFQEGMENVEYFSGDAIGPDVLQTYLEQLAGSEGISITAPILADPSAVVSGGIPTQVPNMVTTSSVVSMLSGGTIGKRIPRKGPVVPSSAPPSGGDPPDDEPPTTAATPQPERPEDPEGIGRGIGTEVAESLLEALSQSGILVNVAHHSYTKSTRAAYRAAYQAVRNTQEYMGQIPGQEEGVSLTTLWSKWGPELSEIAGEPFSGDVSGLGAASLVMRASMGAPGEFKEWATQNIDLIQQIQKSVGRPIEVSKGNLGLKGVKDMLDISGIPYKMVEDLQDMSSERNLVDASITGAGLLSDYLKTEGLKTTAGGGSKLDRLVVNISEESLTKFAKAVETTTVEMESLAKIIAEEGVDSVAGIKAAASMRMQGGQQKIAKAAMAFPAAVQNWQDAMAAAEADPTSAALRSEAIQAADDMQGIISQYTTGQMEAQGPQGSGSRLIRGVVGGWGLMYMSRLAKFPLTQAMFGYAEAEQFRTGMAAYAGGQLGEGISPVPSTAMQLREAQLDYGGQGMAAYQAMQAGLSPAVRDVQGMGLAALAGGAGALYIGDVAKQAGMKVLGRRLIGAAPLVALGAAMGYGLVQQQAWKSQPQQTMATVIGARLQTEEYEDAGGLAGSMFGIKRPTMETALNQFTAWTRETWGMTEEDIKTSGAVEGILRSWAGPEDIRTESGKNILGMLTDEEVPLAAQVYAAGKLPEQMPGLDPDLRGQAFVRIGDYSTIEQMDASVWAQMRGINAPELARELLKAGRRSWTRPDAVALENQIVAEQKTIYEAASLSGGISIMGQLPVATLERMYGAGYGSDVRLLEAAALDLAPWSKSDYGEMILREGALQSGADMYGLRRREPPSKELLDRIRDQDASPREVRDLVNAQVDEQTARTISETLGGYMPASAQRIFDAAMESGQAASFYADAAELMPQAEKLGIPPIQFTQQIAQRGLQGNLLAQQAVGMTQQYAAWGGKETGQFFGFAAGSLENQIRVQRLMSMSPLAFADEALEGAMEFAPFTGTVGMGLGGDITSMGWGATSLADVAQVAGGMSTIQSSVSQATRMWGDQWQDSRVGKAGVFGTTTPFGKEVAGQRGMQWEIRGIQREAQQASLGAAYAQIALQEEYLPQFWAIQDQQRALSHEQRLWGFDVQEQQFQMQGTQFKENMGMQRRGQQMQRGWAMEDWAWQDKTRAMQWGWKQEDFQESVRFMTGRQRELAETQMERETVMYGMEGTRIDTQRERQKEGWSLEDARFEMTKKHFNEQRVLQEENMKKQREFYDEGKKLQDEMIRLQREYQLKQLELQKAAIGAQAQYADELADAQDKMIALGEEQQDRADDLKLMTDRQIEMVNALVGGLNYIAVEGSKTLRSMVDAILDEEKLKLIELWSGPKVSQPGVGGTGEGTDYAIGGPTMPGRLSMVGEGGIEMIKSTVPQHVFPANEVFASVLGGADNMLNDPWAQTVIGTAGGTSTGGNDVHKTIVINIGNERLGEFVLNTVNDALEVR